MQLKPTDRFDALDQERFEDMLQSPPFQIFLGRVRATLEVASGDCERLDDESDLRRAQGRAAALRTVLRLPEQIVEEMKEQRKRR